MAKPFGGFVGTAIPMGHGVTLSQMFSEMIEMSQASLQHDGENETTKAEAGGLCCFYSAPCDIGNMERHTNCKTE